MRLTTEWSTARAFGGKPLKPVLALKRRELFWTMPRKGYRKGIDDRKEPVTRFARTRLPDRLHALVAEDAGRRRLTQSKLLRSILERHYHGASMPRVKAVGASYAIARELNRIGVNLNQIAHLGNAVRLIPVQRLHELLDRLEVTLEKV